MEASIPLMQSTDLIPPNKVPWDGGEVPLNTLRYHHERCKGCGTCTEVCPHGVFTMDHGKAVMTRYEACMECGACALNCPARAILVDSGVGCAAAMIISALKGRKEVTCGPDCCN